LSRRCTMRCVGSSASVLAYPVACQSYQAVLIGRIFKVIEIYGEPRPGSFQPPDLIVVVCQLIPGGTRGEPLIPVLLCSGERLSLAETPPSWALLCLLGCG
jgi:hypothetical protein